MFAQNAIGFWSASASYPACIDDGHHWWYDATDLAQITKDGSDFVSSFKSKGILTRDLLQATGTNQPLWVTPGTIRFDGVDNFLKAVAFTWNQPEYIYLLVKQISHQNVDYWFDGNIVDRGIIYESAAPNVIKPYAGAEPVSTNELTINTWGVVRVLFNGASSKIIVNNNAALTGNFGANNMGGFTLGRSGAAVVGNCANIEVKDIICANIVDAVGDEADIYAFLLSRKP